MIYKRNKTRKRNKKGRGNFQTLYPKLPEPDFTKDLDPELLEKAEALSPMDSMNGWIFGGPNIIDEYYPKKVDKNQNYELKIDQNYFKDPNETRKVKFELAGKVPRRTVRLNSKSGNKVLIRGGAPKKDKTQRRKELFDKDLELAILEQEIKNQEELKELNELFVRGRNSPRYKEYQNRKKKYTRRLKTLTDNKKKLLKGYNYRVDVIKDIESQ